MLLAMPKKMTMTMFQCIESLQCKQWWSAQVMMSLSITQRDVRKESWCLTSGAGARGRDGGMGGWRLKSYSLQLNFVHHIDLYCVHYMAFCLSQLVDGIILLFSRQKHQLTLKFLLF